MSDGDARERSATAGEFVLGTLEGAERAVFERELALNPALQAEVYRWQDRLLGLARHAPAVQPNAALWSRIERGIARGVLRPVEQRHAEPRRRRGAAANEPFWLRLRVWQGISAAALAVVTVLAALLTLRSGAPRDDGAHYLAVLQAPDTQAVGWIVEITAGQRVRLVPVANTAAPQTGQALQFWTKPQGAAGPTSLGLVPASAITELPVSRLPALGERQLFELTLEPATGSPIGRPTGPVLYVGSTLRL
jgi:anti-sigma-K factor RskA